jgi:hypothetical protein
MNQQQRVYISQVTETLPMDISKLDSIIKSRNEIYSALIEAEQEDYKNQGYFHATNQLLSAVDALKTLQLLNHGISPHVTVNVTQNGTVGLLRQALESLGWAHWLSDYSMDSDGELKGFFFHLKDVTEACKYYKDLGRAEEIATWLQIETDLITNGLNLNFYEEKSLSTRTSVLEQKPKLFLPSITQICEGMKLSQNIVTPQVIEMYPGMGTASWLYRWASGFAHGKHWVNKHNPDSRRLSARVPNYFNMTLLISVIHNLIDDLGN